MKKHFTYSSHKQIFRILISDLDHLVLETRDTSTKEVYFSCYNLLTGEPLFQDYQHQERNWIGIEAVYNGIIYFHKYPKQDMPGHKEIIAFDIASQKILWHNQELSFLFAYKEKVYGFIQGYEERYFHALDYSTGQILEDLSNNYQTITLLNNQAEELKNWGNYTYPEILRDDEDAKVKELVYKNIDKQKIAGNVEFAINKGNLFFNYHLKKSGDSYSNIFIASEMNSGKIILEETLNSNAPALFTDSFFIYKEFLFLLKEKNGIEIFKLE